MTAINTTSSGSRQREVSLIVENRQARHLYTIEDTYEAGIMLQGWEVKAILKGQGTFNAGAAFVRIHGGCAYLESLTVTPLPQAAKGALVDLAPNRSRTLLMHKAELKRLEQRIKQGGYTLVPLSITHGSKLKVQIGLAKGKKKADKRETLRERDLSRELAREVKSLTKI